MGGRVSSPVLIGRRAELDALRAALSTVSPGAGPVVTIGGDAGVGKSRLLSELIGSISRETPGTRPFVAVSAAAVEVAAGELAYAPWLEILARLQPHLEAPAAAEAEALAAALTGTDVAAPADSLADAGASRTRQLVRLHAFLAEIATERDVLLVFDDLQWADRSTLDAIAYLANRLAGAPVTILLAYRSDDLHRRHPLRPWLVEIRRHASRLDLDLMPLAPWAVADQVAGILGGHPSNELIRAIVDRADGNPFVVEELVALGRPAGLPESLRDVLLSRLAPLGPSTMAALQVVAIVGRATDRDLLEAVAESTGADLDDALRSAIDARILIVETDPERYRFRHALQREAVLDELLPTERRRIHGRVAEALGSRAAPRPGSSAAEIAHHWAAAQVPDAAFTAYLAAAAAAEAASAWAESAVALDRALGLWDVVDPSTRIGQDRVDLLRRAGWAMEVIGESRRAFGLLEEAISLVDGEAEPDRLAHLCIDAGYAAADLADGRAVGLIDRAIELTEGQRTAARARALGYSAAGRAITGRYRAALERAEVALAVAREVDEPSGLFSAHSARDIALHNLGHAAEADQAYAAALEAARASSQPDAPVIVMLNHLYPALIAGQTETCLRLVESGLEEGRRSGVDAGTTIWFEVSRADFLWWLGRWTECEAALARAAGSKLDGQPGETYWQIRARLAAWQGRHEDVRAALDAAAALAGSGLFAPWSVANLSLIRAEDALWRGEASSALAAADEGLRAVIPTDELAIRSLLLAAAARATADQAVGTAARREAVTIDATAYRELAMAIRTGQLVPGSQPPAAVVPILDLVDAEGSRETARPDPASWSNALEGLLAIGLRPVAAYAGYRLGEALLETGDRLAATDALARARSVAGGLRALPLVTRIEDLARRARLDLATVSRTVATSAEPADDIAVVADAVVDPWGLSDREREVLALVAQGWTNRRIGEALFISPKTASVHVTHILDKLGVSSRTEAALLAGRAGALAPVPGEGEG